MNMMLCEFTMAESASNPELEGAAAYAGASVGLAKSPKSSISSVLL
jgi:hypothetical protein